MKDKLGLNGLFSTLSLTHDKSLPVACGVEMLPKVESEQCISSSNVQS